MSSSSSSTSFDLKCISFHVSQSLLAESDGLRCFTNQFHSSQPDDMQKMCLAAENQKEHLILTKWFKPIWWNLAYGLQWIEYLWKTFQLFWITCKFSWPLVKKISKKERVTLSRYQSFKLSSLQFRQIFKCEKLYDQHTNWVKYCQTQTMRVKREKSKVFSLVMLTATYIHIYIYWIYIFWLYDDDLIVFWLSSTLSFSFPFCQNMFYMMFSLQKNWFTVTVRLSLDLWHNLQLLTSENSNDLFTKEKTMAPLLNRLVTEFGSWA